MRHTNLNKTPSRPSPRLSQDMREERMQVLKLNRQLREEARKEDREPREHRNINAWGREAAE